MHKRKTLKFAITGTVSLLASFNALQAQEMFSVNLWSIGKGSPSVWTDTPSNTQTLTLEPAEAAGLWETTNWQNINFGNAFSGSTGVTTINGSSGSSATFSMPQRRNSSPFYWNAVRNDGDSVHIGNATLLDAHAVGTEDPYDGTLTSILQVTNIPFAVYDVVIYIGINDGQKFSGKGTVNFDGNQQQFTTYTTEPTGLLTQITDAVTPGNYLLYEQITGTSFTAEIWGDDFTHLGPAGFQIREVVDPTALSLEVNTLTGQVKLMGDDTSPFEMNYYQITSAGNSLATANWNSLADQDYDGNGPANGSGNGWEEGGGSGAHALAEGFLLGDSTIPADAQINLGQAYNTALDAQDLIFRYRSASGQSYFGDVIYVATATPGDTDGDGDIDDSDLGTSFANYTGPIGAAGGKTFAQGDTDNDGDVDDSDLGTSLSNYTGPLGPTNVPEPAGLTLLGMGAVALLRRRR